MELGEGARVSLTGLKKRADVNGQAAVVLADAADAAGRWLVFVPATNEKLQVKPVNLGPAPEGESDDGDEEEEEEEDEEGEEGEEGEEEEEEEEGGEEAQEETVVIDYTPSRGRLGLDIEDGSLTVQGVAEDSAAEQGGLERFARWTLAAVGGVEVSTMEAAKVEIAKAAGGGGKKKKGGSGGSGKLTLTFCKAPTTFVTLEQLVQNPRPTAEPAAAAAATSVEATRFSFRIPVDAPLNPGGSIQFRLRSPATDPSLKELHYLVNGKPRPPLKNLSFHLIGDHFARELRFPSLGTCMWLPAEGFAEAYAKLREMAEAAGLSCRGLPLRFNEEKLRHVEGIERDNAEERAAKLTMKKAKGVKNAKKRKIVKRAVAQEGSAAKRARKG